MSAPLDSSPRRSVVWWIVGIIAVLLTYLFCVTVIPRWWAQRVADLVNGRLTAGSIAGVVCGVLFTVLPVMVLLAGWRMRRGWKRMLGFVVVALLVAAPNLATLGIVWGSGNAAHAGERILDVEGPGWRGGSLVGFLIGVAVSVWIVFLSGSRRRNKAKARGYRDELRRREDATER